MSLIGMPFDDTPEDRLAPEGERELQIQEVEWGLSKGDPEAGKPQRRMATITIAVMDIPNCSPIRHWLVLPNDDEYEEAKVDPKAKQRVDMMVRQTRRFLKAFNVNYGPKGWDPEELPMASGKCLVVHETPPGRSEPMAKVLPRKVMDE